MIDFFLIRVLLGEKGMYPKMSLHIWRRRGRRGMAGKVNILSHIHGKKKKKKGADIFVRCHDSMQAKERKRFLI